PFNIYDWGCWARQTIVPLTIVGTFRPATTLPFGLKELWPEGDPGGAVGAPGDSAGSPPRADRAAVGRRDRPKDPRWAAVSAALAGALPLWGRPPPPPPPRPGRRLRRRPATPGAAPVRAVRRAAVRRCLEWIVARQEADGCWGGIQPPWVYSLIALRLLGYGL